PRSLHGVARAQVRWGPEGRAGLGPSGAYALDLAPRADLGAGSLVELLVSAGCHHHTEFKLCERTHARLSDGSWACVPANRAQIFQTKALSLPQKRSLARFLRSCTALAVRASGQDAGLDLPAALRTRPEARAEADPALSRPFAELAAEQGLSPDLTRMVWHGVLLQDRAPVGGGGGARDAEDVDTRPDARDDDAVGAELSTDAALKRLQTYQASLGRFRAGSGAFLLPVHGAGEVPQALCRAAAVKGAAQMLRCRGLAVEREEGGGWRVEVALPGEEEFADGAQKIVQAGRTRALAGAEALLECWVEGTQGSEVDSVPASFDAPRFVHHALAVLDAPPFAEEPHQTVKPVLVSALLRPLGLLKMCVLDCAWAHVLAVRVQDLGDMAAPPTASAQPRHETETAVAPATASVADASALPGREASQPRVIFLATYVTVACNPVRFEHLDALARCPGPSSALTHDDAIAAARSLYSRLFPEDSYGAFPLDRLREVDEQVASDDEAIDQLSRALGKETEPAEV
ncbi:hypothetical protein H632_c428p1, partial [Helicosporidium sp. ATCC 50920]